MGRLHDAASQGDLDQVKKILGQNPKLPTIDEKDTYNRTALFFAVRNNHPEVTKYLLGLGASVKAECSCCKTTALSKAAENGNAVLVRKLMDGGASLTQKNVNGDTPISFARRNGHEDVRKNLRQRKEYEIEELSKAALLSLTEFVGKSNSLSKLCGDNDEEISRRLKPKADLAAKATLKLAQEGASPEITHKLTFLALYDLILLIDDSWTMRFEERGKRLETLEKVVKAVVKMYTSVRYEDTPTTDSQSEKSSGVLAIRFLNSNSKFDNLVPEDVDKLKLLNRTYSGVTKIGTALKKKIMAHFVPEDGDLRNPLLIMILTDGDINGERRGLLEDTIRDCVKKVEQKCGNRFLAFQFSRIGNDTDAREFLQKLDHHPEIGRYVAVETAGFGFDEILKVRSAKRRQRVISTLTKAITKDSDEDNDEESDDDGDNDDDDY